METKHFITVLMAILFVTFPVSAKKNNPNRETVVFKVVMHCHSCQQKIEKNIAFEKGVKAMEVSLEKQTVEIKYDKRKTSVEKLQEAFKKIGYEAKEQKK